MCVELVLKDKKILSGSVLWSCAQHMSPLCTTQHVLKIQGKAERGIKLEH